MPYIISMLIATVAALIIILTRFDVDNSSINSELQRIEYNLKVIDIFADTYAEVNNDNLEGLSFETLNSQNILIPGIVITTDNTVTPLISRWVDESNVQWEIVSSTSSSYDLRITFSGNSTLNSKIQFVESFVGREYCIKNMLATTDTTTATNSDGVLTCTISKM